MPYGNKELEAYIPEESFLFEAQMEKIEILQDFEEVLWEKLNKPIGCKALKELIKKDEKILILVEDNTRNTPVKRILPVLIDYLEESGITLENIEILTAPGTHRIMTEEEVIEKVGEEIYKKIKIYQHDFTSKSDITDLGTVKVGENEFPVLVNKKSLEADFIIGLGNIIPHSDAGFSGGAKIVQPGICGFTTTAATHIAGALLEEIPLGDVNNPCRRGIEEVARKVGLRFIINVVMTPEGEVVDIFSGEFVKAHRAGARISQRVYGVKIPELADIVLVSSCPSDIDYWQADKGLVSAYFSVKKGGYIIFAAPCYEGMEHNHPKLKDWSKLSYKEAIELVKKTSLYDQEADLIAADVALQGIKVREKVKEVMIITSGLSQEEIDILGFVKFDNLQDAINCALKEFPDGKVGVLPRGGDCLPYLDR